MTAEDLLIGRALQGDGDAFDALVMPYQTRAYRTACLITRSPDTAADALQEALLRAYQGLRHFQQGHPFYPWFARIVVNEALRQTKRHAASRFFPHLLMKREKTPEDLVESRENQNQLWRAIQHLSPAHRAVIVLRYYEELTEAEMAKILAVPPGTVKSRLHHARTALERVLQRDGHCQHRTNPMFAGGENHD